jgi:hypothetical protein
MSILNAKPLIVNPAVEGSLGDMAGISACYFDAPLADLHPAIMEASTLKKGDVVNITHRKDATTPIVYVTTFGIVQNDWTIKEISGGTPPPAIKWGEITGNIADQTDLETELAKIGVNKTAISANKANITTNITDIATNKANITTNITDIATNKAKITTNTTDIATNKGNIADNLAVLKNLPHTCIFTADCGTLASPSGTIPVTDVYGLKVTGVKTSAAGVATCVFTFATPLPANTKYAVSCSLASDTVAHAELMKTVTAVVTVKGVDKFTVIIQDSATTPTTADIVVDILAIYK